MKNMKRTLAAALCLAMLGSCMPFGALAEAVNQGEKPLVELIVPVAAVEKSEPLVEKIEPKAEKVAPVLEKIEKIEPAAEKIEKVVSNLENCGVNDLLLSVDAFHQEHIPLDSVLCFAQNAVQAGIPVRLQPAWLVSPKDPNPYNNRTWEIIRKFDPLHISLNQGNVVFPSGNALKYLREYFDENTTVTDPYEEDPKDVRTISFAPDGGVLNGNVYQTDILEMMEQYKP